MITNLCKCSFIQTFIFRLIFAFSDFIILAGNKVNKKIQCQLHRNRTNLAQTKQQLKK